MKHIFKMFIFTVLIAGGMNSCQKETLGLNEAFDIDEYTGRYEFDIELETLRDGELVVTEHRSIGYVTKESSYSFKILFDFAAPKVNCVYEYAVKPDGTFISMYRGAGDRIGKFQNEHVSFSETIDLGEGNYKRLEFLGISKLED